MFWTYNTTSPQIDIILCKEDLTLQELLDQENVLQELKAQNLKLIEFLIKPEILRELVTLITTEPAPETDVADQYKYPNLACELLTSDLPALNERLASEEILSKLYCFLQNDPPLNQLLSSYFSRTLSILISRKSEQNWFSYQYTCLQALEFLKAKEEFMRLLLKHMGTSSIMDLTHNLLTLIEGPELKLSLWNWLQSQNVIPSLINLLSPHSDPDCQMNAASVICSIIQKLRENLADLNDKSESDPILQLLESAEITDLVLSVIFNSDILCDTSIASGIDVLLAIMHPYLPGDAQCRESLNYTVHDRMDSGLIISSNNDKVDGNQSQSEETKNCQSHASTEIIASILPYVKKLKDVLLRPVKPTSNVVSPRLGKARLLVAKLIGVLVSLNSSEINKEIMHCDIPELLLNLFYNYCENNFLHTEVEKMIAYAIDYLNGYAYDEYNDELLLIHLLRKGNLIRRILDIWQENIEDEKQNLPRRAYMGHVIKIATMLHIATENNLHFCEQLVKEVSYELVDEWNAFVDDNLKEIIEKHSSCLGGVRPKLCQSNETSFEENISSKERKSDFKDYEGDDDENVIFSSDPTLFGYGDENYNRLSTDLHDDDDDDESSKVEMFNMVCAQKWQSFTKGLDSLDENEDEEPEPNYTWRGQTKVNLYQVWDSDDENMEEEAENTSDPWSKLGAVQNPWDSSKGCEDLSWNSSKNAEWANFDDNFGGESKSHDTSKSRSSLPTNVDQFHVYNNAAAAAEESGMLNTFSNVKISTTGSDQITEEFNSHSNDSWGAQNDSNSNNSNRFSMQQTMNCIDTMLNLELICGNTLAEKIANAENDIRNKDEIRLRGMQEQTLQSNLRMNSSFDEANEQSTIDAREYDVRITVNNSGSSTGDTSSFEEKTNEQSGSYLSPQDCLTENSIDFVTAENSTSDAESSVEFADAENSLELEEEEFPEKADDDADCHMCNESASMKTECGAVDANAVSDECNKDVVSKEKLVDEKHVEEKSLEAEPCAMVNGDVTEHIISKDCDTIKDACDSCSSSKEELDTNITCTTVNEPA